MCCHEKELHINVSVSTTTQIFTQMITTEANLTAPTQQPTLDEHRTNIGDSLVRGGRT
ncbi:Uncharacterized protein APZ42_018731 [Daphnia magna]|uniref:Uncharacterized protein n=1 Tax=Daphnia magna TaxID=35525 RepID=A0A164YS24_9CRUS|nr:Uncharacterized protein APZ42_018731 [Daphnia magna]